MTDILLPPSLPVAAITWSVDDRTLADESPVTGSVQTSDVYGTRRVRIRLQFQGLSARNRSLQAYRAFVARLQGRRNRVWIRDASYTIGGSLSAPELLTNNDFSNGTTGWTASNCTLSVSDAVMRLTNTKASGAAGFQMYQAATLTQYAPHCIRGFVSALSRSGLPTEVFENDTSIIGRGASTTGGMMTSAWVASNTAFNVYPIVADWLTGQASTARDYVDSSYTSLSRCALIDNGPNALTYSDQLDNAAWTKLHATITANSVAAPDGTTTADTITPSNADHYVNGSATVPAAAAEYSCSVAVKAGSNGWANVGLTDNSLGGTDAYVNLSTGALGTVTTGAGWSGGRAVVVDLGNGWWKVSVTGRKTGSSTTVGMFIKAASANGSIASSGTIYAWRGTFAASSAPIRLTQTTVSATTGAAQTGGGLYLKGLPGSTSGILREGDQVQVGRFLRVVTASLDSDAAGLGLLQLSEAMYPPASDNDPVIFNSPMGRFMLADGQSGYDIEPGIFGNASIELVEA